MHVPQGAVGQCSHQNKINMVDNIFGIIKDNATGTSESKNMNKEDFESLVSVIVKNVIEKTK